MPFAQVIFNLNLDHSFSYHIPEELVEAARPGVRVLAPFGRRDLTGVLVSLQDSVSVDNCKNLLDVLDDEPLVSEELLELTRWMADYYLSSWGQAVQLALPRGIETFSEVHVQIVPPEDMDLETLTERQRELYEIIFRSPGRTVKYYNEKFGRGSFHHLLSRLHEKEFIHLERHMRQPSVRELERKFVTLHEDVLPLIRNDEKRERARQLLPEPVGKDILYTEFIRLTGFSAPRLRKFEEAGQISIGLKEIFRQPEFGFQEEQKQIVLSAEQRAALDQISQSIQTQKFQVHMLHGVTGSGKTQVYLDAIKEVLEAGRTAIVLIPEISLTPQTVRRFEAYFPGKIAVFNSRMSQGERFDAWRRVYNQELSIVVGPRSALFMPLKNLGMIVVDEEHESSYKQTANDPRYNARDVAVYRAHRNEAVVVLGSATPSLESYYNARRGKYNLIEMPSRISKNKMPEITVVDMKGVSRIKGESRLFSKVLMEKIGQTVERGEQVILLQNRRGHSSSLQCMDCGFIMACPNCEITLTYHSFDKNLVCHYCGYRRPAGNYCPVCMGDHIHHAGSGTQKIENELVKHFPLARLLRMDQDTTSGKGAHDRILQTFGAGGADILLGTQMIAKGLDFGKVTLVGVISADIGLMLPDVRTAERVFQLLTQVAGRSGRGDHAGEVVIQSYLFSHYSIQYAQKHDYFNFYMEEMRLRQKHGYPPFNRMFNIKCSAGELGKTIKATRDIARTLKYAAHGNYTVVGPAPSPIPRINNQYRWQLMVLADSSRDPAGEKTRKAIRANIEPIARTAGKQVKIVVDVDPVEML
jgi:primosomal protein N' (replication factor Y)